MKKVLIASGLVLVFIFFACRHEPFQDPYVPIDVNPPLPGDPVICFESDVLPIFVSNCAKSGCHDARTRAEGIRLDSYSNIMRGIRAGQPSESKYWKVIILTDPSDRMPPPPDAPLSKAQKDSIYKWIMQGAPNSTNCAAACDLSKFDYTNTIKPILQNNCNGCHSGSAPDGGLNLTDYNVVRTIALNGRLMGSVKRTAPYKPMPPAGKLTDCQIGRLEKWTLAGAPNN